MSREILLTPHPAEPCCYNAWLDGWCGFIWILQPMPGAPGVRAERRNGNQKLTDSLDDAKRWLAEQNVRLKGVTP